MAFLSVGVAFAARALLVLLFLPFSALDKILNAGQAIAQCEQAIRSRPLAAVLIVAGFGIEVIMSLAIVTGLFDRRSFDRLLDMSVARSLR